MCMHAYVESLKKKKTKRNEGCEKIQKGKKYDSAEMIKMLKSFTERAQGEVHIYTNIHLYTTRAYVCMIARGCTSIQTQYPHTIFF